MLSEEGVVRTFNPPSYVDPADAVADYRRVREYVSGHPDAGSTVVASALDLPRGRVRSWLDGARPDAVRAVEAARSLGWFDAAPTNEVGRAFAVLAAAILSGGSIAAGVFRPRFTTSSPRVTARVEWGLDRLGCGWRRVHAADEDRATELEPSEHGALLGRALVVLGLPTGSKASRDVQMPAFLDEAPRSVRTEWAELYLSNRHVEFAEKDSIMVLEDRPLGYRRALASLLREVSGASVSASESGVSVSAEAARNLGFGRGGPLRRD